MSSSKTYLPKIIDLEVYDELDSRNQKYIKKAEKGHEDSLIYVSSSFLVGKNDFPKNKDIGIKYLAYGTELNLLKVMEQYGTHLILGEVIPKDEEKGIQLLNEVATIKKDASKKLFLVDQILSNESFEIDSTSNRYINYVLAKKILKEAADMGDARAMAKYGSICMKSKKSEYGEIQPDFKEAYKYFKMSSKKGDINGMLFQGVFIEQGFGGAEVNPKEALKLYKAASEKGDLDALAVLGECLINERYDFGDKAEGLRLIKYAFDNGNSVALCWFGSIYKNGYYGFEKDDEKAFKYYKMSVEKKNSSALKYLGDIYKEKEDIQTAIKYYFLSYQNGNVYAADALGDIYFNKDLKEFFDLAKAQKYYKFAIDAGLMRSLCDYCMALSDDDDNMSKNKSNLKKYLEIGDKIKDYETMCLHACILLDGDKLSKNEIWAVNLFKECAQNGDKFAIEQLAEIYEKGNGLIRPDQKEAQKYRKMLEVEEKTVESKCCLLI